MSTSSGAERGLHFDSPPVQQVTLGIYFRPLLDLRNLQFVPILQKWRASYTQIEELPRVPLWRPLSAAEVGKQGGRRTNPPLYILQTADGQRSIDVQNDRLLLTWRFEAEGSPKEYIGYSALKDELVTRFAEFESTLRDAGLSADPERTDATYQNLVDMDVRDFCVGVLTGWELTSSSYNVASSYSGMRFGDLAGDSDQTETLIAIENGPDGEGTDFTIDVERQLLEGETFVDGLDDAHDSVLRNFELICSAELMNSWGRR